MIRSECEAQQEKTNNANQLINKISANNFLTFGTLYAYSNFVEFCSNNGKKKISFQYKDIEQIKISMNTVIEITAYDQKSESFALQAKSDAAEWYALLTNLKKEHQRSCMNNTENISAGFSAKNEQTSEINDQNPFEIIELNRNGVVKGIIQIILGILGYYVFSIVLDRMFGGIWFNLLGWILIFACFSSGIANIVTARKKAYKAICPYCNHEFAFPVEDLNASCPQCNKKIIIKDNKFQIVE